MKGVDGERETEEEEEEEGEISPMFESIGHQPLRGRCPKGEFSSLWTLATLGPLPKRRNERE